jgi:hypothetical protein
VKDLNIPEQQMEDLKWMGWNAGFYTWNTRVYDISWYATLGLFPTSHGERAAENLVAWNDHTDSLEASGLFEPELFADIKWCAWNLAWYATNTQADKFVGYFDTFADYVSNAINKDEEGEGQDMPFDFADWIDLAGEDEQRYILHCNGMSAENILAQEEVADMHEHGWLDAPAENAEEASA